jgi:tetratricopeptide (TPR) repeat protein/transcriptional regulator with XRE-family HTH domain
MDQLEGAPFAEVLHRFRTRARLTQARLSERLGTHRNTVSLWERGEYLPETLTMVLELARVLQLSEADKRLLLEARFGTASILPFANLPEPNPYFTGREAPLAALHAALAAGGPVAVSQPQAISGLGGIGKTQLALAYAARYRAHYHDLLWALAESRETLVTSYVAIAEHLRLELRAAQEPQRVVEAVKRWLGGHRGWLLVLDNIEDLGLVRAFVPSSRQGAVLLTTRRTETSPVARALVLDVLPAEEGALFLLRRAGSLALESELAEAPPQHQATARAIAEALGGLPLALDQAGAYIAETRCALSDYLALLQQERATLLRRRGAVPGEHPASVTATFALAFAEVQQKSETAAELLKLCAVLAPEAIPLELLRQGAAELGPVLAPVTADALACNAALEILQTYSLARRDPEGHTLSLHRLVQAVLLEAMGPEERSLWNARAIAALNAAFPNVWRQVWGQWERCRQLVPHVLALSAATPAEQGSLVLAALLTKAADYAFQRAHYEQAESLYQRALRLREQILGPDHPEVTFPLNGLADAQREQGRYADAEPLYQRAVHLWEGLRAAHSQVPSPLNNLALLYWKQGRYAEAEPLLARALLVAEENFGPDHPEIASYLNNLALLYCDQGRYAEAEPLSWRALSLDEQTFGPDHPEVAYSLNMLGLLSWAQGRYAEAEPLYQRALHIGEQTLGETHPMVTYPLNGLANLYRDQGQFERAEPLYQRVHAIRLQERGAQHPETANNLLDFGRLYERWHRPDQALPLYLQALGILEQCLGPAHPHSRDARVCYTRLLEAGERGAEVPPSQRALDEPVRMCDP